MQTPYAVCERQDDGHMIKLGEVNGSLRKRDQVWEMVTSDETIQGTLEGDPLSSHVFVDEQGREYRVA